MIRKVIAYAAAMLVCSGFHDAASASSIEEHQIGQGKEFIKPSMGYIYLTAPNRFAGSFIRVADEEDLVQYQGERRVAFERALKSYEKDYERWQGKMERLLAGEDAPEKPVKPTEETFNFVSVEQFFATSFGPTFMYAKENGNYAYLEEVKPGVYIWYGPVFFAKNQGYIGQCYCMGTVKFDVAPGVITNLGNSLFAMPRWEDDKGAPTPKIVDNSGLNGFVVKLPEKSDAVGYALPASLASKKSVIPKFQAVGKINNFYRQMIARIAPIDGVITYDLDRVIDLQAEATIGVEHESTATGDISVQ